MRLGDYLSVQDYDAIWGEEKRIERPSIIERLTLWVIVIGVGVGLGFVAGCDGDAAQVTEQAEQEAHQRHVDLVLSDMRAKRFLPTATPIRASDLEANLTVCQQRSDRKWECYAL